ncbi:MAG TPA: hypothetical protein VN203_26965 [Candidatus Acidoferrum sp.]|nr:hypothetical protein [Candidatus Acidoferrum sp.]
MSLRITGFPSPERHALDRCLTLIRERLHHPPGPMPHDLRELLLAIVGKDRPIVDLVYGGAHGVCQEPYARSAGYRVLLCRKAFLPEPWSRHAKRVIRLPAVVFHELVHIARGWELDAEAFENAWFSVQEGATPPDRNDWAVFKEDNYRGWWVFVNPRTRQVTDYSDRPIVKFPPLNDRRKTGQSR